jgi:hypothetical protein
LRRSLLFPLEAVAVEADLEPGVGSVLMGGVLEELERKEDKEREEGIMEEREDEDLLEVMLGNMIFGVFHSSVSVRPGPSSSPSRRPGRRAAAILCSYGAVQRRRDLNEPEQDNESDGRRDEDGTTARDLEVLATVHYYHCHCHGLGWQPVTTILPAASSVQASCGPVERRGLGTGLEVPSLRDVAE